MTFLRILHLFTCLVELVLALGTGAMHVRPRDYLIQKNLGMG